MKSKKFVLAWLVLLAITMVLLPLSGCKNDTVPPEVEKQEQGDGGGSETDKNNTAAKLVSITVTPPARTVYSVGDPFEEAGMTVIAHYNNGTTRTVEGTITTDTTELTRSAGINKPVEVSYTENGIEKTAAFNVDVASYQFTETVQDVVGYVGTMTDGTYKQFGDWPQTIRGDNVKIGEGTLVRGGLTYHVGSDGNYYVAAAENAYGAGTEYKYSNGEQAGQGGTSTKWFKVEPIVWRVLTDNYIDADGITGNALLLAESILTGGIPYYVDTNQRRIGGGNVLDNSWQYSDIRAWLNGSYEETDTQAKTYTDKGFLQTAFTQSAQDLIELTDIPIATPFYDTNFYTKTTDKIFLLSKAEATTLIEPRFAIRVTTDYAKATGAEPSPIEEEGGSGWWWLRSDLYVRIILNNGDAYDSLSSSVFLTDGGVVPALSISLQSNLFLTEN